MSTETLSDKIVIVCAFGITCVVILRAIGGGA